MQYEYVTPNLHEQQKRLDPPVLILKLVVSGQLRLPGNRILSHFNYLFRNR